MTLSSSIWQVQEDRLGNTMDIGLEKVRQMLSVWTFRQLFIITNNTFEHLALELLATFE